MTGNALVPLILAHRERGRARIRAHSLIAVMRVTGIRTVAERHARHAVLSRMCSVRIRPVIDLPLSVATGTFMSRRSLPGKMSPCHATHDIV